MRDERIALGVKAKDRVTGFTGIVTVKHEFLSGCLQWTLTPPVDDKGVLPPMEHFDGERLVFIDEGVPADPVPAGGDHAAELAGVRR